MIYLAVICAGLVIAFVAMIWTGRKIISEMNGMVRDLQAATAEERRDLLRRIHAPQVAAVMDYNDQAVENPPAVDMTDTEIGDESYWLSREELAEKMAAEELGG